MRRKKRNGLYPPLQRKPSMRFRTHIESKNMFIIKEPTKSRKVADALHTIYLIALLVYIHYSTSQQKIIFKIIWIVLKKDLIAQNKKNKVSNSSQIIHTKWIPLADLTPDTFNSLDEKLKYQIASGRTPDLSQNKRYLDFLKCRNFFLNTTPEKNIAPPYYFWGKTRSKLSATRLDSRCWTSFINAIPKAN